MGRYHRVFSTLYYLPTQKELKCILLPSASSAQRLKAPGVEVLLYCKIRFVFCGNSWMRALLHSPYPICLNSSWICESYKSKMYLPTRWNIILKLTPSTYVISVEIQANIAALLCSLGANFSSDFLFGQYERSVNLSWNASIIAEFFSRIFVSKNSSGISGLFFRSVPTSVMFFSSNFCAAPIEVNQLSQTEVRFVP